MSFPNNPYARGGASGRHHIGPAGPGGEPLRLPLTRHRPLHRLRGRLVGGGVRLYKGLHMGQQRTVIIALSCSCWRGCKSMWRRREDVALFFVHVWWGTWLAGGGSAGHHIAVMMPVHVGLAWAEVFELNSAVDACEDVVHFAKNKIRNRSTSSF